MFFTVFTFVLILTIKDSCQFFSFFKVSELCIQECSEKFRDVGNYDNVSSIFLNTYKNKICLQGNLLRGGGGSHDPDKSIHSE